MSQPDSFLRHVSRHAIAIAVVAYLALGFLGCTVNERENNRGSKDAEIKTPIGGLKVKTNIDPKDVGLDLYPGARLKPSEDSDKENRSANVNISTPMFGLRVILLDYESDDPPQKIIDFYKKDLGRYGKIAECKGTKEEFTPSDEFKLTLDCETSGKGNVTQLKAGEGNSQHIVGVTPQGKGTEFGLVYIQKRGKAETM